jgi:hypothetical protein
MFNIFRIKRRTSGSAGAPDALSNGELAFNEVDGTLYYGKADNTIIAIGGDGAFATTATTQQVEGDKTFTSNVVLSSATATTTSSTASGTEVATTAFVQSVFSVLDGGDFEGNPYVPPTPSGVGKYFYSTSSTAWSLLTNWYTDSNHTLLAASLPTSVTDVVVLGNVAPIVNLDMPYWVQPNSINSGTAGIVLSSNNSVNVTCNIVGPVTFNGNATYNL